MQSGEILEWQQEAIWKPLQSFTADALRSCKPGSRGNALSQISGHILSQRRLRSSDKNFENILFANVNFEGFDAELRKRKQPERDDDVEWFSKILTNSCFCYKNGGSFKNGRAFKKTVEKRGGTMFRKTA